MMMRGFTLLLVLWIQGAIGIASAQEMDDELGRKRSVLSSIRAANDCIANEALRDQSIAQAKSPQQFRAVLEKPMRHCADELDAMVAMHDSVYFLGAGEAFFQGPYLKTLPQAVRQRIAPKLARRAAEALRAQQDKAALAALAALAASTPLVSTSEPIDDERHQAAGQEPRPAEDAREPVATDVPPASVPVSHPALLSQEDGEPTRTSAPPPPQIAETVSHQHAREDAHASWLLILGAGGLVLRTVWCAIRNNRRRRPLRLKYRSSVIANRILSGQMWPGMTAEMLRDSRGDPTHIRRQIHKTRTTEVWRYVQTGKNRFKNRITIENGIVIGFEQP